MKKIILLILILLVSGCTTEYNLTIENNKFNENIKIDISKSLIDYTPTIPGVEKDDQITPLIENPVSAFFSTSNKNYDKKVEETENSYNINLKYNYTFDEFKGSNSINSCFENIEMNGEDVYYINLNGNFYCLYSDSIDIKIKTNNEVIRHNADRKEGNTYIWNIHSGNSNNVDILFEVSKDIKNKSIILEISIIIVLLIILGIVLKVIKKKNEENNKFE